MSGVVAEEIKNRAMWIAAGKAPTASVVFFLRIGGIMKAWIGIAMVMALAVCATMASSAQDRQPAAAAQAKPAAGAVVPDDNMTPYRKLAADSLTAFKAHDMPTAKKKARELEVAWDKGEKTLEKKSPDVWGQIDKAMDAFIKPVMHDKSPDPAKVQTAHDAFIAALQLAIKSDAPKSEGSAF